MTRGARKVERIGRFRKGTLLLVAHQRVLIQMPKAVAVSIAVASEYTFIYRAILWRRRRILVVYADGVSKTGSVGDNAVLL